VRCVAELVEAGIELRFVLVSPRLGQVSGGLHLAAELAQRGIELVEVDEADLDGVAATESPQGIVAVCAQPGGAVVAPRRVLLADAIQDPGNLGTLIRSAAAFGMDAVYALEGTVDPYNPKVVRSSAGAIGRVPVRSMAWEEVAADLEARGVPVIATASNGAPVAARGDTAWALAVGNEARGVSAAVAARATATVAVPMPGGIDSLNAGVAGSILMYALTQPEQEVPSAE
jgi:TrmH family RNA methyltransferase